jgi:hypothetical protein
VFNIIKRKNKKIFRNYKLNLDDYSLIEFYNLVVKHIENLKQQINDKKTSVHELPNLIQSRNVFMKLSLDMGFMKYEEEYSNLKPVADEVDYICSEWLLKNKDDETLSDCNFNGKTLIKATEPIREGVSYECL